MPLDFDSVCSNNSSLDGNNFQASFNNNYLRLQIGGFIFDMDEETAQALANFINSQTSKRYE